MHPPQYPAPSGQQLSNSELPLALPLYGAGFGQAIKRFFKKYATFSGRASRSEFWWMYLFAWLAEFAIIIIAVIGGLVTMDPSQPGAPGPGVVAGGFVLGPFILVMIVPTIALMVRRLHDIDFSAWWLLLLFALSIGALVLLIFALLPSNPRGARFDKDGGRRAMGGNPGQPPYPPQQGQPQPGQSQQFPPNGF